MEHLNTLTQLIPIIGGSLAVLAALLRLATTLLQERTRRRPSTENDNITTRQPKLCQRELAKELPDNDDFAPHA